MTSNTTTKYDFIDSTGSNNAAIAQGIDWLIQHGGGVFLARTKQSLKAIFELRTDTQYTQFERECRAKRITLAYFHKRLSLSGNVFAMYSTIDELCEIEKYGQVESLLFLPWFDEEKEWFESTYMLKRNPSLPKDIEHVLSQIANTASGYDTGLDDREVRRLKADLMQNWKYWSDVEPADVKAKCIALGMKGCDADTVAKRVRDRRDGKQFRTPQGTSGFRHASSSERVDAYSLLSTTGKPHAEQGRS